MNNLKIITFFCLSLVMLTCLGCINQVNDYQGIDIDSESIQMAYQHAVFPVIQWLKEFESRGEPYPKVLPEEYQSYLDIIEPVATYYYHYDDEYEIQIFDYADYGFHYSYSNVNNKWVLDK